MLGAVGHAGARRRRSRTAEAVAARPRREPAVRDAARARSAHASDVGLAVLTGVLDPAVIVLGGYFVPLGDLVLDPPAPSSTGGRSRAVQVGARSSGVGLLGTQAAALGAAERRLRRRCSPASSIALR